MVQDAELQAKIAALAGSINKHKQQQHQPSLTTPDPARRLHAPHPPAYRYSPYPSARPIRPPPHQNRTLVLNGSQASPPRTAIPGAADSSEAFVSARAPGRQQLMNKDTYDRELKRLQQYNDNARVSKRQKIDRRERRALMQHANVSATSEHRELVVDGIRFQLRDDGSKLMRIHDATTDNRPTPKRITIANVDFCRTKTGNLVRTNAIRELIKSKNPAPCEQFTKHGTCPFGPSCKFSHDPNKVAMCKTFLKGSCPAGDACDLSHEPTYHRVPACTHFLRGNCTNNTCPYPHVHVSDSAPVCRTFSTLHYCPLGEECAKRHLFVCADHVNHGKCANKKCTMPHPDHAGAMRKAAARLAKTGSEEQSDVSSDEDEHDDQMGVDDIDSDDAETFMAGADDADHALSQQQDFISFSEA
ncbi:hypothetical protein BDY17DRAFT_300689 [Neohortaea acidophila]|uniref:C3H1-type domain-containing protein n=1 Tax=Neohortaea acidophila TaxID=245834 RepID=A0A6A6PMQ1_9PEZI|nr:uncharacterized protein BDY17DRAFT_300689 [Neohortaea acidophila]KAF2481096.1 hypothetical protein BDY17DRAFT_300689 [Neohortaea acidophila]